MRTVYLILTMLIAVGFCSSVEAQQVKPVPEGFCFTQDTMFCINKASGVEPYYYAGTNNYYVMYKPMTMVTDILDDMVSLNLKVLRMWFFMDGTKDNDGYKIQTAAGVYDEATLKHIDEVVYEASKRDIKILPVMINYWSDFGGMPQYAQWAGAAATDFYSNATCKQYYKQYVSMWLNRVNSKSGIKYKDDPTIFAWQLTNEARSTRQTVSAYVAWATEMSAYVRSLDPYHMICMGDEGLMNYTYDEARNSTEITTDWTYTNGEGDYNALVDVPNLDYATFHNYATDNWSKDIVWGLQWTKHHIKVAHAKNKPCVMEEYDYGYSGNWTTAFDQTRATYYQQYIDMIENLGMAGDHSWMLIGLNYWDKLETGYTLDATQPVDKLWLYRVKWSDGHQYSKYDTYTAAVIKAHGLKMMNKNILNSPSAFALLTPSEGSVAVKVNNLFTWEASAYATSYKIVVSKNADISSPVATITDIKKTECLVMNLEHSTKYYWQVTALNVKGSKVSSVRSFTTQATPPAVSSFSLTSPKSTGVSVSKTSFAWSASANADYYTLKVSTQSDLSAPIIEEGAIGNNSYTATVDLAKATKYYYQLKAINSKPSEYVVVGSFTTQLNEGVIDDFNVYADCSAMQNAWSRNTGGESITVCPTTQNASVGNAMNINYTFGSGGYCGVILTKSLSLLGYEGVAFMLTPDGSGNELIIQLRENSDEYWEGKVYLTGITTTRVFIPFAEFKKPSWNSSGNGVLDLGTISNVALYLGGTGGSNKSFQIDELTASFKSLPTVITNNNESTFTVDCYPNPVVDVLNISVSALLPSVISLELYNLQGILVLRSEKDLSIGDNLLSIDVKNMVKPGIYILHLKGEQLNVTRKIVIK